MQEARGGQGWAPRCGWTLASPSPRGAWVRVGWLLSPAPPTHPAGLAEAPDTPDEELGSSSLTNTQALGFGPLTRQAGVSGRVCLSPSAPVPPDAEARNPRARLQRRRGPALRAVAPDALLPKEGRPCPRPE